MSSLLLYSNLCILVCCEIKASLKWWEFADVVWRKWKTFPLISYLTMSKWKARLTLIDPTSCRDDLVSTAIVLFSNNSSCVFSVTSLMTVIIYRWHEREKDLHTNKKSVKGPVFPEVGLTKYRWLPAFTATIASVSIFPFCHISLK